MFIEKAFAIGSTTVKTGGTLFESRMEFGDFILLAISCVVLFAGLFSIMYILRGGVLLILSGGKDDKIKPAIDSIRYAIIGLVVIVLSIFVFPRIAGLLGLDATRYSSPDKIFSEIKRLGDKILKSNSSDVYYEENIKDVKTLPNDFSDL